MERGSAEWSGVFVVFVVAVFACHGIVFVVLGEERVVGFIAERGADSEERTGDILVLCAHYDSKTNPLSGDPFAEDKTGAAVLLR